MNVESIITQLQDQSKFAITAIDHLAGEFLQVSAI